MKTIVTREDLEDRIDAVDGQNTHAVVTLESGAFKKETEYSMCWVDLYAVDEETVELEAHIYAEGVDTPIDQIIDFSAKNPVEGINNELDLYNDVLEAGSFRDKVETLGFDVDSLADFPMNIDVFALIMRNYLTDLKAVLEDTEIDMTDF